MVHRLVVSYGQPPDPGAFDAYYRQTHAPLALAQPGLIRLTYGHAQSLDPRQPGPYLVAELDFDSAEAMAEAMSTPEWAAAGEDVPHFATGGASVTFFDVEDVGRRP